MRQQEFQKILEKYRKGLCTPEEQALVEKWFRAMDSSEDVIDESAKAEIRNRSWARVHEHIHKSEKRRVPGVSTKRSIYSSRRVWAVAASVSVVALCAVLIMRGPVLNKEQPSNFAALKRTISNDTSTQMEVLLEDGSRVLLQPKSKLTFKKSFERQQRVITLDGEAFFDVSRDTLRPFVVHTREVITRVLGTSFTVSAFANHETITVAVMTGKVSVTTKKDKDSGNTSLEETILTPNQKMTYNKTNHIVSRGIVNDPMPIVPAESLKRLHFEAAPINDIFAALERVYGVDITFDENTFASCILTTSIAEGNIYNRLDMICEAIDAEYVVHENHIVVTGPGCNVE